VLFVLICVVMPAAAQDTGPPKPYLEQKEEYRIFVLGDSLAAGLLSGLTRMAADDERLSVDGRYKEDSGLARPEYYDWNDALPKILESNQIDIAVVMIGTNDAQAIRDGNLRHRFGTPEWNLLYAAKVDRLMAGLKQAGAAVYWLGLPAMASARYEAEVRAIDAIQADRAKAAGVKYVSTLEAFPPKDGRWTDMGVDETGQPARVRTRDGVHFLRAGNNRLGALVLAAISADIETADGKGEVAAGDQAAPSGAQPSGPVFGQAAAEGGDTIVHLEASAGNTDPRMGKTDFAGSGGIVPSHPSLAELAKSASPGSAAARLFTLGESPPARPGRFDDFRMPQ
jgi:hypothetical protein